MESRNAAPERKKEFLNQVANDYGFFQKTREVFLARFDEENAASKNTEIAKHMGMPHQEFQDYLREICDKLGFSSNGKGRHPKGKSPWEKAFTWLWNEKFVEIRELEVPIAHSEPEHKLLIHRQVCQGMLVEKRRLTTNPLTTGDGTTFERGDVYVPLGLVERKRQAKRTDDDSPEQGSKLYEPTEYEVTRRFEHEEFFEQVLRQGLSPKSRGKRIAIIGEPGAGKTTLLQQIADWVFEDTDQDVAIWVSLADLQGRTLEEYLLSVWLKDALKRTRVTPEMEDSLVELFNRGRVWLLLDGVDEMTAEASGNAPLQAIAKQLTTGWVSSARVVLTCRLNIWDAGKNALERFDTYRTLDFSYGNGKKPDSDQVNQFISKWFEPSDPQLGKALRTALDQRGKERIKDLVKNPLRLALMCYSWQRRQGELPKTKATLYQRFVEVFYEWKQEYFPTTSATRQELNQALGQLAVEAIAQSTSRFRLTRRFVSSVLGEPDAPMFQLAIQLGWLNQVGVAAEDPDEPVYAFYHPTFQEYFAALAIDDWHCFLNHIPGNPDLGIYRVFEPQWKEVILLWLGREDVLKQGKEEFIKALVNFENECWYFYRHRAYLLAAAAIAEFRDCSLREEIVGMIIDWSFSSSYVGIGKIKGKYRNHKDLDSSFKWDETDLMEDYHGFLPARETTDNLIKWRDSDLRNSVPPAEIAREVLKETDSITAISLLVNLLESEDIDQEEVALLLGQIDPGNEMAITILVKEIVDYWHEPESLEQKVEKLQQVDPGNETVIDFLFDQIQSFGGEYIESLAKFAPGNQAAIAYLVEELQTVEYDHEYAYWLLATGLGKIDLGNKIAIATLVQLIDSSKKYYCSEEFLKYPGNLDQSLCNVEGLEAFVSDMEDFVHSLEEMVVTPEFEDSFPDDTQSFAFYKNRCILSVRSLGEIDPGNKIAISALVELIAPNQDEFILDDETRRYAAYILGKIDPGSEKAITVLIELMHKSHENKDWSLLLDVINSLGIIGKGNEKAISALVNLIQTTKNYGICVEAAENLGKIDLGNEISITTLIKLILTDWGEVEGMPERLEGILQGERQFPKVVKALKHYMTEEVFIDKFFFYRSCHNVLWRCAQNMSYPDYYRAWHGKPSSV
jgi:HEAT repeat protein/energy-coupling factor transporter ATP-binding protein EcfA2